MGDTDGTLGVGVAGPRRLRLGSFSELEQLALSVRSRAAFGTSSDTAGRQVSGRWHGTVAFQGALGLVMLFALGATAGVLVVTGSSLWFRWRSPSAGPPARSPAGPVRSATTPRRAPRPPATLSAPAIASQRVPSTAPTGGSAAKTDAPNAIARVDSESEFSLVSRAQASLATDPVRALALVSDHGRQFPNGTLVEECEIIAIDALLRLGRHPDAEARARAFKDRFPASVHRRRLEVLLGVPATVPSHRR
jgi:hypothetical protein